ncbi:hypothetical protein FOA52_011951 [Chlamydomonas sp. UWO 241]|nr:hypothetical protein FOA52_011951 [Chlamydomonas sp. UWO 241]
MTRSKARKHSAAAGALIARAATTTESPAQAQQIASLVDVVSLLVSRVPGAPMQMPHAEPARARAAMRPTVRCPALRLLPRLLSLPGPLLLPPLWRRRGGGPATERPASGATRAASARGPSRRGGLPARVGDTSLRRSFVLSIPVARGANWFLAGGGRRMDEEEATAAAAVRIAAAAEDGTSLPVRLARDVVRFLYGGTGRREPADGGVVSASLLNAKPAVGGIGVEPRGGGVLRVLFTVASDAVADTVVRWRHELRRCVDSTAVFDVLSDREEAQHQALWPAFLAAKVAGKRAQFHRARLVVDGERVKALQKGQVELAPQVAAPPPALRVPAHACAIVDCGVQLLNRQFDRDQLKGQHTITRTRDAPQVMQRAADAGVEAFVSFTTDFEKAESLVRLAKESAGSVYAMVGVHSDMIHRSNDLSPARLEQLRALMLRPESVALFAGLDFSRDVGIRYAQERALVEQMDLAADVGLPCMLYLIGGGDALIEKIADFRAKHPTHRTGAAPRVAVYNFAGAPDDLAALAALDAYVVVCGAAADPGEAGERLRGALAQGCPLTRLLVASDAPYGTPQSIADAHVRAGRNEPSNLLAVVAALAGAYGLGEPELCATLRANAARLFGLRDAGTGAEGEVAEGEGAAVEEEGGRGARSGSDSEDGAVSGSDAGGADGAAAAGAQPALRTQRRQRAQPSGTAAAAPAAKKLPRSYLPAPAGGAPGAPPPRVTYACRSCRSVLLCEGDIRPHASGARGGCGGAGGGWDTAEFKRGGGKKGKGKQRDWHEDDQLCSLHFLVAPLVWMTAGGGGGDGAEAEGTPAMSADGRVGCPCCGAKLGKFSAAAAGVACACGLEMPAPAYGLLHARLDLIDAGLSLERAVQSTLQLYEDGEGGFEDGGCASSSDGEGGRSSRKKKGKQAKGRGNTSNMGDFRNKAFGAKPAKPGKKTGGAASFAALADNAPGSEGESG